MFEYENKYKSLGLVAGIDEAGRGPLAGPVVCACVIMPLEEDKIIEGINDSKKLSAKKRADLYEKIINTAIDYCIVPIDEKTIDEINILNATKLGMEKALENRYEIKIDKDQETLEIFDEICKKRKCLLKQGELDYDRCAILILDDFRKGRLGKIVLD